MVKKFLKKILPSFVWRFYYWSWSFLASFFYGHPSSSLIVVGITGTAGKSTVANLICRILEEAGNQVGLTTTFNFRIAGQEFENKKKMTMLGRFSLQKLLAQMKKQGCDYALIELLLKVLNNIVIGELIMMWEFLLIYLQNILSGTEVLKNIVKLKKSFLPI